MYGEISGEKTINNKKISGPSGTTALALILAEFGEGSLLNDADGLVQATRSQEDLAGQPLRPPAPPEKASTKSHAIPLNTEPRKQLTPPLKPGWLVAYYDRTKQLRGGPSERDHSTVKTVKLGQNGWLVHLTDGTQLPERAIVSVGKVNQEGKVIAFWSTRYHGLDGEK
ncbi:MAG: hypothetical protein KC592_05770 [Nitrospira sp.]|nr:hypothetical protein [Nitrospira sp.]